MFELNNSLEKMIIERFKPEIEELLNTIMYEEREMFLECYNTVGDGYNSRKLQTTLQFNLELKVPKVREYSKDLNYSVFKKYQRKTEEFENLFKKMYTSRLYQSDIQDLLDMSSISYARKKKIINEFYDKYLDFIQEQKKATKMLKMDCTYFHSKKSKLKYSVYTVFNCHKEGLEVIYYHIAKGNENKAGWEHIINYLIQNVDLSECKLIVTDMFRNLKDLLHEKEEFKHIKKQNCIWHRIHSLCDCVKVNKAQRNQLISDIYVEFMKMKKKDETIFDCFNEFESRSRKIQKYIAVRDVKKAMKINFDDNFSFLEVREELRQDYRKKNLILTSDVESYFSGLKFYLKKHTNYASIKVLTSKMMMYIEKENEKILNKKSSKN